MIIIEGVDKVLDSKSQPVSPLFWLPDISLRNVKIILTATKVTPDLEQLFGNQIEHVLPENQIKEAKHKIYQQYPSLKSMLMDGKISNGDLKLAAEIIKAHPQFEKILKSEPISFESFIQQFINFVSPGSTDTAKKILGCLIWTKKGLTKMIIKKALKLSSSEIEQYMNCFRPFILSFREQNIILNERVRQIISLFIDKENSKRQKEAI